MHLSEVRVEVCRWMKVVLHCVKWRASSLLWLQGSGKADMLSLVEYNRSGRRDRQFMPKMFRTDHISSQNYPLFLIP
jgi:hypothetical protein